MPPLTIRELRDLTHYREALIDERSRELNRIHKTLKDAGIKLATVAFDVIGCRAGDMMRALIAGRADPEALADLIRGKLRSKVPALRKAADGIGSGSITRLLAGAHAAHVEDLEPDIAALSEQIEAATFLSCAERRRTLKRSRHFVCYELPPKTILLENSAFYHASRRMPGIRTEPQSTKVEPVQNPSPLSVR